MPTEVMVLKFTTATGADHMLDILKDLQSQDFIELLDAVVVTKDDDQKVHVRQPLEVGPARGAAFGALTGAIVGLLGGPGGVIVGFVSGALTGGTAAAAMEAGLPENEIKAAASDELKPRQSALLVYFDEVWIDQIEQAIANFGAGITRRVLKAKRDAEQKHEAEVRKEKIDAANKSWQAAIDKQRTDLASLRQKVSATAQADYDAVRKQVNTAESKLDAFYKNILHTLQVWQHQLNDNINKLEAQAKQASGQAKTDLDQRVASAKQARDTARADAKATLTARLNNLKAQIDHLKAQAANTRGETKSKLDKQIAKMQSDWEAEQKRLDKLDNAYGDAWEAMVTSIDDAIGTYETSADAAETEYARANK